MKACPKCGGEFSGPIYMDNQYQYGECLLYRCRKCGYRKHKPTLDYFKEQGDRYFQNITKLINEQCDVEEEI